MGGRRERFRETSVRTIRIVDLRAPRLLLVHDAGVLELLDERLFAPKMKPSVQALKNVSPDVLISSVAHVQRLLAGIHVPETKQSSFAKARSDGRTT